MKTRNPIRRRRLGFFIVKSDYVENAEALMVPSCETINVLRLAKRNKELPKDEYEKWRF